MTLTAPADGSRTSDTTPAYSGAGGQRGGRQRVGDGEGLRRGRDGAGSPVQTLTATRSGGTWTVDGSPALAEGTYTAQASQADDAGNTGTSAARTFTVDTTAPAVAIAAPADGARMNDATPDITGSGGTGAGDAGTVTLRLYAGSTPTGSPLQTGTPAVGGGGGWSFTATDAAGGHLHGAGDPGRHGREQRHEHGQDVHGRHHAARRDVDGTGRRLAHERHDADVLGRRGQRDR